MNCGEIDKHLDAVLRASGSALRHFSMQKTLDDMRAAMRAAMTSPSWTLVSDPPDADTTVMMALSDGEVWQGYLDGDTWRDVSGVPLAAGRVTYWAHTPAHPGEPTQPPIESWHTGLPLPGEARG